MSKNRETGGREPGNDRGKGGEKDYELGERERRGGGDQGEKGEIIDNIVFVRIRIG